MDRKENKSFGFKRLIQHLIVQKFIFQTFLIYFIFVSIGWTETFPTQEECEQKTGKQCGFQMCDYIPKGKTFEEVCGKDFEGGWVPTLGLAENEGLLFEELFNDINNSPDHLEYSGNENGQIVKEAFLGKSPAYRITLNRLKDKVSYRSEVMPTGLKEPHFTAGKYAVIGKEYWYGVRIFIPRDWEVDKLYEIILQWHATPDSHLNEQWRSPPLNLTVRKNNYFIKIRSDSGRLTPPGGYKKRYERDEEHDIGDITSSLGEWTDWVFHVKWSYRDDGFVEVWKDKKKVLDLQNQSNAFNDQTGPFWKMGIYKPQWNDEKVDSPIYERVIYYDNIRIANKNGSYETVDPHNP